MKRLTNLIWLFMAFGLVLSACGGAGATAVPAVDMGPAFTQVAGTAVALQTRIAQVEMMETSIAMPTSTPQPTATLEPTSTPQPSETPVPTSAPTAAPVIVNPTPNGTLPAYAGPQPTMKVSLITNNDETYSAILTVGQPLILRVRVENTSDIVMQVVANLDVPQGWDVDQDKFSDCPTNNSFDRHEVCTTSWYFTPQVSGHVYLRVYVRGIYTDANGNSQRITDSPAFDLLVNPS